MASKPTIIFTFFPSKKESFKYKFPLRSNMNAELVKDYLLEFSKRPLPDMVPRELIVAFNRKFVISIVGPRRAGKTFYFFQLMRKASGKKCIYLNFEDTRLFETNFKEIRKIIRLYAELFGELPKYLFFDEIQNVKNWEIAVRELYDTFQYHIFLTGSSSKLLSKEISTQLRGRSLTYLFFPFSFSEFLHFKRFSMEKLSKDEESLLKRLLRDYLEFGGFPDIISSDLKEKLLKEYFDAVLFKDVIERHAVKNLHLVSLIFKQIINSFSKEFSVNALYNTFKSQGVKVSKDTMYQYLNYFEDSVSAFFVKRYSEKLRVKEAWPRKVYLADTGLSKVLKTSEDTGKLMENSVFLHLLSLKNEKPLIEITYYRDYTGKEVDFVIKEGVKVSHLIQVTYASGFDEIRQNEIKNLLAAANALKCKNLAIVTWDYEETKTIKEHSIMFVPLWKFLTSKGLLSIR